MQVALWDFQKVTERTVYKPHSAIVFNIRCIAACAPPPIPPPPARPVMPDDVTGTASQWGLPNAVMSRSAVPAKTLLCVSAADRLGRARKRVRRGQGSVPALNGTMSA